MWGSLHSIMSQLQRNHPLYPLPVSADDPGHQETVTTLWPKKNYFPTVYRHLRLRRDCEKGALAPLLARLGPPLYTIVPVRSTAHVLERMSLRDIRNFFLLYHTTQDRPAILSELHPPPLLSSSSLAFPHGTIVVACSVKFKAATNNDDASSFGAFL